MCGEYEDIMGVTLMGLGFRICNVSLTDPAEEMWRTFQTLPGRGGVFR